MVRFRTDNNTRLVVVNDDNSLLTTIVAIGNMRLGYRRMKTTNHNKAFGIALAKLRKEKHWSQEYLSFESDLTRTYISLLERGQRSPTLNTIFQIASALNVGVDEVVRQTLNELSANTHNTNSSR